MIKQTVYYIASCEKNPYETGSHMALETESHMALVTLTKLIRWIAIITFNTEFKMLKIDFLLAYMVIVANYTHELTER